MVVRQPQRPARLNASGDIFSLYMMSCPLYSCLPTSFCTAICPPILQFFLALCLQSSTMQHPSAQVYLERSYQRMALGAPCSGPGSSWVGGTARSTCPGRRTGMGASGGHAGGCGKCMGAWCHVSTDSQRTSRKYYGNDGRAACCSGSLCGPRGTAMASRRGRPSATILAGFTNASRAALVVVEGKHGGSKRGPQVV